MARDYAKPRNPNAPRKGGPARGGRGAPPRRPAGGGKGHGGGGGGGALPGWVWGVVISAIVAVVAAFAYIDRPQHRTRLGEAAVKDGPEASPLVSKSPATSRDGEPRKGKDKDRDDGKARAPGTTTAGDGSGKAAKPDGKTPVTDAEVSRNYTFYNELQKIEVPIPREYARPAPPGQPALKPPPPAIREALAAPGSYLVQVGAYKTREDADRQRARLALLGYESRIEQGASGSGGVVFRVRVGPQPTLAAAQSVMSRLDGNGINGYLVKLKD